MIVNQTEQNALIKKRWNWETGEIVEQSFRIDKYHNKLLYSETVTFSDQVKAAVIYPSNDELDLMVMVGEEPYYEGKFHKYPIHNELFTENRTALHGTDSEEFLMETHTIRMGDKSYIFEISNVGPTIFKLMSNSSMTALEFDKYHEKISGTLDITINGRHRTRSTRPTQQYTYI
ncbi:MAG TPA: hypothetical protein VGF14_02690 [Alphaproteobacteria bacterium]